MPLPANVAVTIKEECVNILHSPEFRRSPVMSHLLEFLVDYCVERDARGPKAYVVAVDGLGRSPSFDTNIDSYPRVQVGRLRKIIAAYYAEHPRSHRLHIPVGHYQVQLLEFDAVPLVPDAGAAPDDSVSGDVFHRGSRKPAFATSRLSWWLFLIGIGVNLGILGIFALATR